MTVQAAAPSVGQYRVLLIQFAGDYRDGYNRVVSGSGETYHSQRYSIEITQEIGRKYGHVGVLCCCGKAPYDELMDDGVRAMGAGLSGGDFRSEPVIARIEAFQPTHLVARGPFREIIKWAVSRGIDVLPCFADSFALSTIGLSPIKAILRSVKHHVTCRRLASLLNSPQIRWVSNHNIKACQDLERIGVDPRKIVPWDWEQRVVPESFEPKTGPDPGAPWKIVYVGSITETKGVGDAIEGVAELKQRGLDAELRLIGTGDVDSFTRRASELHVSDRVHFEGLQPNSRVIEAMKSSDLVLIPSQHRYPEGLPCVFYEAFATRTPVVCSDHPMFQGVVSEEAAVLVPERRPASLADAVTAVLSDPDRYQRMSRATLEGWHRFQCPVRLHQLFDHWLGASEEDDQWLANHCLASGRYPR